LLAVIVASAWPAERKIDVGNPTAARRLVELFFAGQFVLVALTAPAFAAGSLAGEKERKTYEMLLATALTPGAIVRGKWLASFAPSLLLTIASLPIVMLCLPLGGISFYEAAAAYASLVAVTACFTLLSLFASAYFSRTVAALLSSYVVVLPVTVLGLVAWRLSAGGGAVVRLWLFFGVVPISALLASWTAFAVLRRRLRFPPDVGSEGREVIDEERELREAVGLVLRRDEFPDRLFAPPKRTEPLADDANPVLDKELRSELFSQGTLVLRLVIQISLLLAVPIMGACLYLRPEWSPWYFCYVLLFNALVGPAFSAGTVSNERERRTLDLLLTTTLRPSTILWGKLLGGMRVSAVLTSLLLWPVVLACLLVPEFRPNLASFAAMTIVVGLTCLLTPTLSLLSSVWAERSNTSLTAAYLSLGGLFWLTPAADLFGRTFFAASPLAAVLHGLSLTSPAAAMFRAPLSFPSTLGEGTIVQPADWPLFAGHVVFQLIAIPAIWFATGRVFRSRYEAAEV
jgi:ABC-type transport system involved in multi-copper enzyme maturation permease subunit